MTDKKERTEKLTRDDLRSINVGETKTFTLPNARACDNGKSLAYQFQNILECKFKVATNYQSNQLTITRTTL